MKNKSLSSDSPEISVSFETKRPHPQYTILWERLCLYVVTLVAACGMNWLMEDALRLDVSLGVKLGLPLLFLLLLSLLIPSRKPFWKQKSFWLGVSLTAVAAWLLSLAADMNPIRYLLAGGARLWNHAMRLIDSFGFVTLAPFALGEKVQDSAIFVLLSCLTVTVFFVLGLAAISVTSNQG